MEMMIRMTMMMTMGMTRMRRLIEEPLMHVQSKWYAIFAISLHYLVGELRSMEVAAMTTMVIAHIPASDLIGCRFESHHECSEANQRFLAPFLRICNRLRMGARNEYMNV